MSIKIRDKNPILKDLVEKLQKEKAPVWKAVAKGLNRPRRVEHKVNLFKLERFGDPKFTIVVPGVVLGSGELKKKLNVAALKFSKPAEEAIQKAGGKCMEIEELVKTNPAGKGVKILG